MLTKKETIEQVMALLVAMLAGVATVYAVTVFMVEVMG